MANNKLSLKLDGAVPLALYNEAVARFAALVSKLTEEISSPNSITWMVTGLRVGSTFSEVTGISDTPEEVDRVISGVRIVWQSVARRQMIPYSEEIEREAVGLTAILNGKVTAVRISAGDDVIATVNEPITLEQQKKFDVRDFGSVEGAISSVTDRPALVLGLYDDVFGKRVECRLGNDFTERAREIWKKHVRITGMIKRHPDTGHPISINDVTNIEELRVIEGGFLKAKGLFTNSFTHEPAEQTIRRIRDGE